ncbi:MAG TPA: NAD(P)-dependent oxidoreductase [Magnetovibrio sp.]
MTVGELGLNGAGKTNIVVTGASGFVGSHALMALWRGLGERRGDLVAACRDQDRLPSGYGGAVAIGDLNDPDYRRTLVQNADVVIHAAAWTSLFGHKKQSDRLFLKPSLALLEDAVQAGVGRFIQVSSTSAAPPSLAANADAPGRAPAFWPHLGNVVAIEDAMRRHATGKTSMVTLRLGLFTGERYGLGLLPILVPRMKSYLVPWVAGGKTPMPLIAGEDIGAAFLQATVTQGLAGYEGFNIVGPSTPTVREVIGYLAKTYRLPKPWFSVPFALAHVFALSMEAVAKLTPWDPFITRSIVYLLRDFQVSNEKAERVLGYRPKIDWKNALDRQMAEMSVRQTSPMAMAKPLTR